MDASGITLQVLPDYQLKLCFPNGSEAIIDMKRRVHAIRFGRLASQELFEAAQHIRTSRANSAEQERHIPLNTRGNSLLAGNVYCGHCGARLSLTTNGKAYPCKDDPHRVIKRVRYICYGKTRKQTIAHFIKVRKGDRFRAIQHVQKGRVVDKIGRGVDYRFYDVFGNIVTARIAAEICKVQCLFFYQNGTYIKIAAI